MSFYSDDDFDHPRRNNILERLAGRLNLDFNYDNQKRCQHTDRSNRAVAEQVLDPRTRMILLKLINRNLFYHLNGCISTGKEANVYHALTEDGRHLAVKIYKSTILTFKARDQYVTGEYRFRQGYCRGNPRKMVGVWAEKEMRNLRRLNAAGIASPVPHLLKLHVLVMDMIGDGPTGLPAPRLKDAAADIDPVLAEALYGQALRMVRRLYQDCRLVHADLSEYNLLLCEGQLVVIDVSQSVEHDHPRALDFLRHDCANVLRFFRALGIRTLGLQAFFAFVTDPEINDIDTFLADAHMHEGDDGVACEADQLKAFTAMNDEAVFRNAYIPRTLEEVIDAERDISKLNRGETQDLLYTQLLKDTNSLQISGEDSDSEDSEVKDSDDSFDDNDPPPLSKEDLKTQRKLHKKAVKEEKREKRAHKLKKHVKKRKEKTSE